MASNLSLNRVEVERHVEILFPYGTIFLVVDIKLPLPQTCGRPFIRVSLMPYLSQIPDNQIQMKLPEVLAFAIPTYSHTRFLFRSQVVEILEHNNNVGCKHVLQIHFFPLYKLKFTSLDSFTSLKHVNMNSSGFSDFFFLQRKEIFITSPSRKVTL